MNSPPRWGSTATVPIGPGPPSSTRSKIWRAKGHVGYPEPGVVEHTTKLVEIDQLIVEAAVKSAVAEKTVIRETVEGESWLYLDCPLPGRGRPCPIRSPDRIGHAAPHAEDRHGKGHCLGRRKAGDQTGSRAAGGDPAGHASKRCSSSRAAPALERPHSSVASSKSSPRRS